ncbi:hypothetical protein UFOVP1176_18 [uncultured Caudovirales phage]|uniref:Uncharacterized protein n=1 Tax=uncultured Caudovirales phage TaxID=2100421 RepID=A0A6J5R4C1_9CAUD|nr:hypothetical protein UFOVP1176_18 [uncultured Caudovirales phage]
MLKVANSVINASQITGVLPVVNGGTGVTTSTGTGNTVLSAAPTLSGDVSLSTGNLVQGTAAKGVNFTANTPLAGMTSQLLNNYEEGSWTPLVVPSAGAITTQSGEGFYVKVGRSVTVYGCVRITTAGTATGALSIRQFPFTAINTAFNARANAAVLRNNGPNGDSFQIYLNDNTVIASTASFNGLLDPPMLDGYEYVFGFTYIST